MNLAIIGGGPAGLSAAIRARELGLEDVWVIERLSTLGGILNQCIHHGFGIQVFKEELTGPEYAQRLIDRAVMLGVQFALGSMVIDISGEREIIYANPDGMHRVHANAIILTMGCRERTRGAIGIPGSRGVGIYTAGTAQALINMKGFCIGKKAVILGSGDIGLIMARRMTLEGAKVLGVYEVMPVSSGLRRNIVQCLHDYDIPLYLSHTVTRTVGQHRLEGVYIAQVDAQMQPLLDTEILIECDVFLLSVGLIPENELAKKIGVALHPVTGGAVVDSNLETNIPGVYAAGNALHVHDIVDYVTQEAYHAAEAIAQKNSAVPVHKIPVHAGSGVRYTVPMTLNYAAVARCGLGECDDPNSTPAHHEFCISFRSDAVYQPAVIAVLGDGVLIKTQKKRIIVPSEMERVTIILDQVYEKIEVRIS